MNVRTDRETDRQKSHTLRICGARSGSHQIPSESGTCDKQNVIWIKLIGLIKCALLYAIYVLHYLIVKLCFILNYTYPHSSIQLKLSALLLMYKCWYIPCHDGWLIMSSLSLLADSLVTKMMCIHNIANKCHVQWPEISRGCLNS